MLTLRRATAADAPAAARVIAEALAEYGLPFEPEGRDADVATFGGASQRDDFVVHDGADVVGLGSVGPQGAPGRAWISKVFVDRAARRQGAGRLLMNALHDAARAAGCHEVGLRSRVVFEPALAMYAAFGYARRDEDGPLLETGDVVLYRIL